MFGPGCIHTGVKVTVPHLQSPLNIRLSCFLTQNMHLFLIKQPTLKLIYNCTCGIVTFPVDTDFPDFTDVQHTHSYLEFKPNKYFRVIIFSIVNHLCMTQHLREVIKLFPSLQGSGKDRKVYCKEAPRLTFFVIVYPKSH